MSCCRLASVLLLAAAVTLAMSPTQAAEQLEEAVFAMGCFWCGEEAMEKVPGVLSVDSGYTGGDKVNPTYYEVVRGGTGHLEAVRVVFDAGQISYEDLLPFFWHNVNPTQGNGQFCDVGDSYVSAIFFMDPAQEQAAEASLQMIQETHPSWNVQTEILPAKEFYDAEDYHQDYYLKNPTAYNSYKNGCGRVNTLKQVWGEEAYYEYHPTGSVDRDITSISGSDGSFSGGSASIVNDSDSKAASGGSSSPQALSGSSNEENTSGSTGITSLTFLRQEMLAACLSAAAAAFLL
eukprot:CAMPEP_0117674648 /NCGR_PEP_ID=MMETSP0804-20121206/15154_1 /TAXON_ID=1074897 /ORGANISM="Tetraselmis astigmatica, Strain CCMP880" /LENGTH=290 /DNA_ID=CAMNT_0005483539 /DNA_START=73 /DNA_END=945 /DNA_ORIENTATION=-